MKLNLSFGRKPTGKASGPDTINNRILRDLAHPLSTPLKDLFNFSLEKGQVPIIWKQANVTPIFNYRPISLLSTVGKALEKIVLTKCFWSRCFVSLFVLFCCLFICKR